MIEYSKQELATDNDLYEKVKEECRLGIREPLSDTCINISKVTADKYKKLADENKQEKPLHGINNIPKKKIDAANKHYTKKLIDTSYTLIHLIDFLKENFPIFEKFGSVAYESLLCHGSFSDDDEHAFYSSLSHCLNLPICELPNIDEFGNLMIKKGMKKEDKNNDFTKRLLTSFILQDSGDYALKIVARGILCK